MPLIACRLNVECIGLHRPHQFDDAHLLNCIRRQEKGVLAKGVPEESIVTSKKPKNTQGYQTQQYIWHSGRQAKRGIDLCKKNLLKPPFSLSLIVNISSNIRFAITLTFFIFRNCLIHYLGVKSPEAPRPLNYTETS